MIDPNSKSLNMEQKILQWRQDPITAAKEIFDIELDIPQQIDLKYRWMHDSHIAIFSRGCGKTFLSGLDASLSSILWPGNKIGLLGPSYRQSRLMFTECERLYERSPLFQSLCLKPPVRQPESCTLRLKAVPGYPGSFIEALPVGNDGSKIRGARYYKVIVDEVAQLDPAILDTVIRGFLATTSDPMGNVRLMKEQRELLASGKITKEQMVRPISNKFILTSTAFYQYNHLWQRVSKVIDQVVGEYEMLKRQGKDTSHITLKGGPLNGGQIPYRVISNGRVGMTAFTCTDMSEGFMNMESIKQAKVEMSEYMFMMEYMALFPSDSEGFFRRSMLDGCRRHNEFGLMDEPRKGMIYVMGVDPARTSDNFAVSIFEVDPVVEVVRLVRVYTWNSKSFPHMHHEIRKLIKEWKVQYFKMDSGGGGQTIRDLLADKQICPAGDKVILEIDNVDHRVLVGERMLGPLCEFSNYDWLSNANHNMLSAMQHGRMQIAAPTESVPGMIYRPWMDDAAEEMEAALQELSSIITVPVGGRIRWDTPTKTQRKDRYSAILIGYDAAQHVLNRLSKPKILAIGGWMTTQAAKIGQRVMG